MKFKIGQKVRVNRNLKDIENFETGYVDNMKILEGKIVTITCVDGNSIRIRESIYTWDKRAFSILKPTKEELFNTPIGTKIYTNAEDEDYQEWIKISEKDFTTTAIGVDEYIDEDEINDDLTFSLTEYGTQITKIEEPEYSTIYYYQEEEKKEMTISEIEKELGYSIKVVKEGKDK